MRTRISAGQVITGDDTVYDGGVVVVEDGEISDVGPAEHVSASDPDVEYDLSGHTLMPGIIDAHTHISSNGSPDAAHESLFRSPAQEVADAIKNARTTVEAGITTIRDVGSALDSAMVVRNEVSAGSFVGPRIKACGEGLTATGGHAAVGPWHLSDAKEGGLGYTADGEAEVKQGVREQLHRGADAIKVWATGGVIDPEGEIETLEYSQSELDALVAEADRHNVHVASHAHPPTGILSSVEAGVRSIEHGMYMDEESMIAMAENDVYLTLTMAVMQTINQSEAVPEYYRTNTKEAIDYRRSRMDEALDHGVNFTMGTDAGAPTMPHGENMLELECMVDAGLDPLQAIEISSRQTAEMLDIGDTVGVLEEGYAADVLAVAGDPLDDISVLRDSSSIELVMVDGREMKNELHEDVA